MTRRKTEPAKLRALARAASSKPAPARTAKAVVREITTDPVESQDAPAADAAAAQPGLYDASAEVTSQQPQPGPVAVVPVSEPLPEEPEQPPALIQIDIDPAVSGGFIHGRYDLQIKGRVISADPVEEISLHVDGETVSVAQYGQPDRSAVVVLPDGSHGRQRSFLFTLPRPQRRAEGRVHCHISARTIGEQVGEEQFELAVDPNDPIPVTVVAGPTRSTAGTAGPRPPVVLYVERATVDSDGNLTVHGWVVALTTVITVQVFVDETRVSAARLGGEREDVATVYPTYPNARTSGFTLTATLHEADRSATSIRAQAICLHGFSQEVVVPLERVSARSARSAPEPMAAPSPVDGLSPSQPFLLQQRPVYQITAGFRITAEPLLAVPTLASAPTVAPIPVPVPVRTLVNLPAPALVDDRLWNPRREIHAFCDSASLTEDGFLTVVGWSVCAAEIASVSILLDDNPVGESELGFERPDVAEEYAHIPMARRSGFRFAKRVAVHTPGEHSVRIVARNGEGDTKDEAIQVVAVPAAEAAPPQPEEVPASEPAVFRFELDNPPLVDGVVVEPITGRLTIEGWVLARSGVAGMEVHLDGQRLGDAHYGLARQDVGAAFPDWENALRSGYAFHCPPRSLRDGQHEVQLTVRAVSGHEHVQRFTITVKKSEEHDDHASIRRRISRVESAAFENLLASLDYHPAFRVILRHTGSIEPERLRITLMALRRQTYPLWRVVVLVDAADQVSALQVLIAETVAEFVNRFTVIGPADADWTTALASDDTVSELIGVVGPGDELGADTFAEMAIAGGLRRHADFLYADETRISPVSREREAFFKPDFSPDLLLSTNYIGRPWFAAASLLHQTGATPASLAADGEYDLVLRCTELAAHVHHLPVLLCQRGAAELDSDEASAAALARVAVRGGFPAEVLPAIIPGTFRLKRTAPATGKVSIIIPTCAAHGYIEQCIETLRAKTAYRDYEILVIDNIPETEADWKSWVAGKADKIVDIPDAFNWSRFNNRAVDAADGEYLLFLNDDIEIVQDDWLDVLLEQMQRPEVAIVGPQLLYPDRKVQHAGMFLATNGIGRHAFRFAAEDDPCYFGLALTQRNVMAVTGACMLVRRETFERLGRFDEAHEIVNNDLDFCLRAHRAGLLTVFTPYATLIHYELASRDRLKDVFDLSHFNAHWKTLFAAGDPYFSPRLSRHADDYRPDDESVQTVFAGHPMFYAEDIRRILVVKLDHIGDFVTSLPAIRKLKQVFPQATLTVLAGRASRAFAELEPAIDAFIPFDFFHARSQLGERELTKGDFNALLAQLAPYQFDLAVDLRKHLSTRDVLRYTGARFLAGFDYMGQFPFLDIALEWDGDKTLHRKRGHVVDDLMSLVAAIGVACEQDRLLMHPTPEPPPIEELPEAIRPLFDKPVVAIHPGAGNITKQWPEEHFSALIDLLIERNGVNVLLVGGPDEAELAETLIASVLNPNAVASMAGKTSLSELPRLLAACTLYIGNDSGPKHIAAALGVATIGIHSGVVDATEWGPVGPRAVALRRNMTCSPCYLANADDCPRGLACLRFLEPSLVQRTAEMLLARPLDRPVVQVLPEWTPAAAEAFAEDDEPAAVAERPKAAVTVLPRAKPKPDPKPKSRPKRRKTTRTAAE